ncbi:hypothetical protein GIB67_034577 [Kingdonia uniflora]|uniref:aspartate--tRNA ligase n=1 Tax=Kingdonia uniflora TaxID=39325 RepID=A0A7J7MXG8_9MAGN|nr:hypothetical protein GIB67_034577 [Kingdonia uniflora]
MFLFVQNTSRIEFRKGIEMLKAVGLEIDPHGDLTTEADKILGELVLKEYGTNFFILTGFPKAARSFYTLACCNDEEYTYSFGAFLRGQEIVTGGQRIDVTTHLIDSVEKHKIEKKTLQSFLDSFKYGVPPHGGFGAGLKRIVMLYLGLQNIRLTSLFPQDPSTLEP